MKRKIFSTLFALVLLTGLSLVPAVVMGQGSSTYAGYTLGEAGSDAAEWSTTNTAPSGSYSAKLTSGTGGSDHAWVQFIPPTGISLAEFVAAPATYGFTYWRTEDKIGPLLEMRFTDGGDALAEITVDMALYDYVTDNLTGQWIVKTASATEQCMYYGEDSADVGLSGTGTLGDLSDLITDIAAGAAADDAAAVGAWEMTRVRVDLGWSGDTQDSAWVDDVIIDGTTYDLEPFAPFDDYYMVGDAISVTVCRGNANADTMAIEEIGVIVTSTTDTTGDNVTLTETDSDTGVFTGSVTLLDAPPANRTNDEIVVSDEDTVTITLTADWGSGSQALTPTTTVDDSSPVITIVSPTVSENTTDVAPEIKATYTDVGSGTDNATAVMKVNGSAVTANATTSQITYTPSANLTDGSYAVTVDISDVAGNAATQASWSFTVDTVDPDITGQVATPSVVPPSVSSNITLTATVADATPGSGIETVTINVSSIDSATALAMTDDGGGTYSVNTTTSVTITDATYYLLVTATDFAGNSDSANITLIVSSDTTAPVISSPAITYLYGLTSAPPGGTVTISANVTEAVGMGTVTAACTALVGTPVSLTQGVGDVWSVTATVASVASGNYTITIAAVDAKSNVATPDATLTLTVAAAVTGCEITLEEGWNLISLPLIPDDSDITVVISVTTLASANVTSVGIIRGYDPATGTFPSYTPETGSGDLTEMVDGVGYWVFMEEADTLTTTGRQWPVPPAVPPTYDVVVGWNLIGFKSTGNSIDYAVGPPETGYLLNIAGTYPVLWSYDAVTGQYSNVKDVADGMEVGHGFWIWITEVGIIVPPTN